MGDAIVEKLTREQAGQQLHAIEAQIGPISAARARSRAGLLTNT